MLVYSVSENTYLCMCTMEIIKSAEPKTIFNKHNVTYIAM